MIILGKKKKVKINGRTYRVEQRWQGYTDSRGQIIYENKLSISGTRINRISEIKKFEKLVPLDELEIFSCKMVEIDGLENQNSLRRLDLSYNNISEKK